MATLHFQIDVTVEDIQQGKQGQCKTCPIALATARTLGMPVHVGLTYIFTDALTGKLASEVQDFISCFDKGQTIKPFSFDVEMRSYGALARELYTPPAAHEPKGNL